jgi:hypothetical protein
MKVAVLNFSGNVGKTTIAAQFLQPRMPAGVRVFSVESINQDASADGVDVERTRGAKFGALVDELMGLDDAIVDVGASNVEAFLKLMQQYAGSHEEFDVFLVPTVKEKKVQADTVNTIRALAALGVNAEKIRVVFNKIDVDDSIQDEFAALFGLAAAEQSCIVDPAAVIYANEVFERMKGVGRSLGDIAQDPTDYRALVRTATTEDQRDQAVNMVALKRLAVSANANLDRAYGALFAEA